MNLKTFFSNLIFCSSLFIPKISSHGNNEKLVSFEKYYNLRQKQENRTKRIMNNSVDPCDDFYEYACGNWNNVHPIPRYEKKFDIFKLLDKKTYKKLNKLLNAGNNINSKLVEPEDTTKNQVQLTETKIMDFYKSCMKTDEIERRGAEPLLGFLEKFGGWPVLKTNWITPNNYDLLLLVGEVSLYNVKVLINGKVGRNISNVKQFIFYIAQPTFLLKEEVPSIKKIQSTLKLLGVNEDIANQTAESIVQFEKDLYATVKSEIFKEYDEVLFLPIEKLQNNYTSVNWMRFIKNAMNLTNVTNETNIAITNAKYLNKVMKFLQQKSIKDIFNYILWYLVDSQLDLLSNEFQNVAKTFRSETEDLQNVMPRGMSCAKQSIDYMGMAVSAFYIKRMNKNIEEIRIDLIKIAAQIKTLLYASLQNWMDTQSLDVVSQKLKMVMKIGHDDYILNDTVIDQLYQNYQIDSMKYFENIVNMRLLKTGKDLRTLNEEEEEEVPLPVIKTEAFFHILKNKMIILNGILQLPFYHTLLPNFYKYSGIGFVIAHEIMHGFDASGRSFDVFGEYNENLFSEDSIEHFHQMDDCLEKQYSSYSIDGHKLDGYLTLRDNFADTLGIKFAFYAYRNWLNVNQNNQNDESIEGLNLTSKQLYYLTFAQNFCVTLKPGSVVSEIEDDPHATGKYRIIGTLSNSEEFANEFHCPIGSKMNPVKKCSLPN